MIPPLSSWLRSHSPGRTLWVHRNSLAAGLLAVGLTFGAGCKSEGSPAAEGKKLYGTACAKCHGDEGKGGIVTTPGGSTSRDLTNAAWQASVTDEELRQLIRDGRGPMPAFGAIFSVDRIDTVVKHVRTFRKPSKPKAK
ncbi:MAG: mono/diheme cytochrome c family protein [Polyangiales bacterium]|jgi:mono/diheme cytochrome c family protein